MIATLTTNMALASLAILAVLALRQPVARWLGAGAAYALWLVPALRLLMPPVELFARPLLSLPVPLGTLAGGAAPLPPVGGPGQWVPVLLAVWAGGAVAFLGRELWRYHAFVRRVDESARVLGRHAGVLLVESEGVDGPVAYGLLHRRIAVPLDFTTRWSPAEQRLALRHERLHHARGDLWFASAALGFLAINWFNPLAWIGHRAFRADAELACDAAVAATLSSGERRTYAHALCKSASHPGAMTACPLTRADQLKRRLTMMNTHRTGRTRRLGGTALVAGLGTAALGLSVPVLAQTAGAKAAPTVDQIIVMKRDDFATGTPEGKIKLEELMARCPEQEELSAAVANAPAPGAPAARVIFCGTVAGEPERRLQVLKGVRAAMAGKSDLTGDKRAKTLAAIDEEIARSQSN